MKEKHLSKKSRGTLRQKRGNLEWFGHGGKKESRGGNLEESCEIRNLEKTNFASDLRCHRKLKVVITQSQTYISLCLKTKFNKN